MNVHDEFTRRVAADRLCRELARAIAENDTAALERLGMRGFGLYAGRLSELMTDSVRRELLGTDDFAGTDFGAIMGEVAKPAHYAHHLVNEGGSAIQQALDRRNGVRLRVVEPEFNDGRLKGIVGQIAESDSENAADNLATQLGTFVKDMGNEFMRQNAEQRDRAGFKVTVTRTGGAKCCPWCADRTGKWELANAPDGVFGCHDNCKCMVDYTNSKGTVRGRASGKKWNFSEIPYEPPRVLTKEEAAERGGFDKPKRLTGEKGISGKQSSRTEENTVDLNYINSEEYKHKFRGITGNDKVDRQLYNQAVAQLIHRNGTYGEDLTLINSLSGEIEGRQSKSKTENGVDYNRSLTRAIKNNPPYSLISIHNHGTNNPPTGSDLVSNGGRKYKLGIVVTHNGRVFTYKAGNKPFHSKSFDYVVDKNRSKGYNEFDAIIETLKQYERDYGIEWSER